MERPYIIKSTSCHFCDGEGYDETISDCCSEKRDPDTMLCHCCHDHCGPMECPECNGKGYLNTVYDDIVDPDHILNHETTLP